MGDRIRIDAEVERAVLGALLTNPPQAFVAVRPSYGDALLLTGDHFNGARRKLYEIVWALWRRNSPIDPLAIRSELREAGDELAADEVMECARQPYRLLGLRALVHRLEILRERRDSRGKKGDAPNA